MLLLDDNCDPFVETIASFLRWILFLFKKGCETHDQDNCRHCYMCFGHTENDDDNILTRKHVKHALNSHVTTAYLDYILCKNERKLLFLSHDVILLLLLLVYKTFKCLFLQLFRVSSERQRNLWFGKTCFILPKINR